MGQYRVVKKTLTLNRAAESVPLSDTVFRLGFSVLFISEVDVGIVSEVTEQCIECGRIKVMDMQCTWCAMAAQEEDSRKRFEAWYRSLWPNPASEAEFQWHIRWNEARRQYSDGSVCLAWKAWQAALSK